MASDEELRKLQRQFAAITDGLARATGEVETILFKDFAVKYLEEKGNNTELRESTKRAFEQQVRKNLIPDFGHLPLHGTPWRAEFNKWVTATRKKNEGNTRPHVTRFFNPRKDLKEILLAAHRAGHLEGVPVLDNPDEKRDTGRELKQAEIVSLLWKARRPFRVIFMAFYRSGCRPREILKWEWGFLRKDDEGGTWVNVPARITKVKNARSIPISRRLAYILRIRERHGNRSLYVFPSRDNLEKPRHSYNDAWKRATGLAGLAKTVPYDMRRTRASLWAREKVEISEASRLLGTSPTMLHNFYIKQSAKSMKETVK